MDESAQTSWANLATDKGLEVRQSAARWCAGEDHDTDVEEHCPHGQVGADGRGGMSSLTWLSMREGKRGRAPRRAAGETTGRSIARRTKGDIGNPVGRREISGTRHRERGHSTTAMCDASVRKASSAERRGAGSAAMRRGRKALVLRRREGLLWQK